MPDCDVLIVGGGPVGATVALALRGAGLEVRLLEARSPQKARSDPRPIALSHGSRLILERLAVWEQLQPATPIRRIHVSQRGGFGRVMLDADDVRLPALGYVVDYGRLATALAAALDAQRACRTVQATVHALDGGADAARASFDAGRGREQAAARLIAVADGGTLAAASMRVRTYRQAVVTARVACEIPHRNVAYERFTPEGPLALLPTDDRLALLWTTGPEQAGALCELTDAGFLDALQRAFGGRLGAFSSAGPRSQFPLALKVARRETQPRMVALGNASQTLHPVAGQGLNLGLRDAWELAESIRGCPLDEVGGSVHLDSYRARRRLDRSGGIGFTDALVRLFSNDIAPVRLARGLGLAALGAVPPTRDFVVRRMIFGSRG